MAGPVTPRPADGCTTPTAMAAASAARPARADLSPQRAFPPQSGRPYAPSPTASAKGCFMRYNQLGRTGLYVSEICLGTMTFGGEPDKGRWGAIGSLGQGEVDQVIDRALEAGVNFIDTADVYAYGNSESLTGQALKNLGVKRKDVVLATKVLGEMGPGPNDRGASRGHIMDSVQASLERLQTDHIDLYQIHGTDPVTPIDEILRALDDLQRQGLVRYFGVSNWTAWRIAKALGLSEAKGWGRIETLQAYYSIAGRDLERELVPLMTEEK